MTTTAFELDDLIVPKTVLEGYLKGYDAKFQKEILSVMRSYYRGNSEQLIPNGMATVNVVIGPHGVGKSGIVEMVCDKLKGNAFVCDVDRILQKFQGYRQAIADIPSLLQHEFHGSIAYEGKRHGEIIEEATARFRNAAKLVSDMAMTAAIREGFNVIIETNGKTPAIGHFLNNIRNASTDLEGSRVSHMKSWACCAPVSVAAAGFKSRVDEKQDIGIPEEQRAAEQKAMHANLPKILAKGGDEVTLLWRQHPGQPLLEVLTLKGNEYACGYKEARIGFDAFMVDDGMATDRLMAGKRRLDIAPGGATPHARAA